MASAFHEVRFPDNISYGSTGGPGFSTNIIETDSGAEQRVARWSLPRHSYNVSKGIQTYQDLMDVKHFYIARTGCAFGFRYKDWADFTTNADGITGSTALDEFLVPIDGSDVKFQFVKRYVSGGVSVVRVLTKLVAGRVHIAVNGIATGVGWSVNLNSGIVTFDGPPEGSVQGGCEFDVPVRFGIDVDTELKMSFDDFSSGSIPDIPLIEIKDAGGGYAQIDFGGAEEYCLGANVQLTTSNKRLQLVQPTADGFDVILPPEEDVPYGGPIYCIINTSPTYSFNIKLDDGTLFLLLAHGKAITMMMGIADGDPTWYGTGA